MGNSIRVIGGDFGEAVIGQVATSFTGKFLSIVVSRGLFKKAHVILRESIADVEVLNGSSRISGSGVVGGAVVGTVLAGPLGFVVGTLLGGKKSEVTLMITCHDGKRLLCSVDSSAYHIILAATMMKVS